MTRADDEARRRFREGEISPVLLQQARSDTLLHAFIGAYLAGNIATYEQMLEFAVEHLVNDRQRLIKDCARLQMMQPMQIIIQSDKNKEDICSLTQKTPPST
jgi:hypothetical protein